MTIVDLSKKEIVEEMATLKKYNIKDAVEEYKFLCVRGYSLGFILMLIFGG